MSNLLQLATTCLPSSDSLSQYMTWANQYPILSEEEEQRLAQRFYEEGDVTAAQTLVLSHLRFVVKIANNYTGYGLALPDLVQEGTIGLMKGVKRYNPNVGVRFVSFAVHWVKAEIHEFVIRNWRIVKVATTKAQRKLFFNIRKQKKRLGFFSDSEVNMVAETLGVKREDVLKMEMRLNGNDVAFDFSHEEDSESEVTRPAYFLSAPSELEPLAQLSNETEQQYQHANLFEALHLLDNRSQDILQHRWLNEKKLTLKELALKYQVSIERVRQLEKSALEKLKINLLQPENA